MTQNQLIYMAGLAVLIFWAVGAYNRLVCLKNTIANAFGQMDVELKRRYDLIASLVDAAKPYVGPEQAGQQHAGQKHAGPEREMLDSVIASKNQAKSASDSARRRPTDSLAITTLADAEQALSNSLKQLFALDDAYPELKADTTIRELSQELTSSENKVTFARQAFNDAVLDYNQARGQFPALLLAKLFTFVPAATLQATEGGEDLKATRLAN